MGLAQRKAKHSNFAQLDGQHPWRSVSPEGYVDYSVRRLPNCRVLYFNFALAGEMGLVSEGVQSLSPKLESEILDTFALRIVNEYDLIHRKNSWSLLPKKFMATRYLQSQHKNTNGKTSGDGRSIWNGVVHFEGKTWDVSSRGTGVTCLAPGAALAARPLKTGNRLHGYGCGLADVDEMISCAVQSEIFHLSGISTERTLAVIQDEEGNGIGVRAGQNLLRPAHLFRYLKLKKKTELESSVKYFISRQSVPESKGWPMRRFLENFQKSLAKFVARLEEDLIFVWLDWDGDNMLLEPGIIDYGSVRQFGSLHDEYRYDDISRFSTSLPEQKEKARRILMTMVQAIDYVESGFKSPQLNYTKHQLVTDFEKRVDEERHVRFLYQLGFSEEESRVLKSKYPKLVLRAFGQYYKLAKVKSRSRVERLPDGIDRPPLFLMRTFVRNWISHSQHSLSARIKVAVRAPHLRPRAQRFESIFRDLEVSLNLLFEKGAKDPSSFLSNCVRRNSATRLSGNSVVHLTNYILEHKDQAQNLMDWLINYSTGRRCLSLAAEQVQEMLKIIEKNSHTI